MSPRINTAGVSQNDVPEPDQQRVRRGDGSVTEVNARPTAPEPEEKEAKSSPGSSSSPSEKNSETTSEKKPTGSGTQSRARTTGNR